jgi:ribosome-binding factor A
MSRGHPRESARAPAHGRGLSSKGQAPRAPTQRSLRAGELVRHAVADILARGEVHDPVLEGRLVTVPEVRMSPDLRIATVYILPLGGQESSRDKDNAAVLEALDRNRRHIRAEVARRVNLKFAPEIRFRIDERFDEAERIDRLLRTPQVKRDLDNDSGEPE